MLDLWFAYRLNKRVFRTSDDGQKLFYPNSNFGSGYILPSEEIYKRILHGYMAFLIAAFPLGILGAYLILKNYLLGFLGLMALYVIAYTLWAQIQVHDLAKVK